MFAVILAAACVSVFLHIKSDETFYLCKKLTIGDFEDITYSKRNSFNIVYLKFK